MRNLHIQRTGFAVLTTLYVLLLFYSANCVFHHEALSNLQEISSNKLNHSHSHAKESGNSVDSAACRFVQNVCQSALSSSGPALLVILVAALLKLCDNSSYEKIFRNFFSSRAPPFMTA